MLIGSGYVYGSGSGFGFGSGSGDGDGYGYGSGFGFGYGSGDGDGYGFGFGFGYGFGSGYGSGYGSGDGYGSCPLMCRAVLVWPGYVKVGCQTHSVSHWREHWQTIAREREDDIDADTVAAVLEWAEQASAELLAKWEDKQ